MNIIFYNKFLFVAFGGAPERGHGLARVAGPVLGHPQCEEEFDAVGGDPAGGLGPAQGLTIGGLRARRPPPGSPRTGLAPTRATPPPGPGPRRGPPAPATRRRAGTRARRRGAAAGRRGRR